MYILQHSHISLKQATFLPQGTVIRHKAEFHKFPAQPDIFYGALRLSDTQISALINLDGNLEFFKALY